MRYRDELNPAQGLEGFDHGMESPAFSLFLQLGLDALHSLVVFADRPHVLLEDDLLGGDGTDYLGEPAKMCRPPARHRSVRRATGRPSVTAAIGLAGRTRALEVRACRATLVSASGRGDRPPEQASRDAVIEGVQARYHGQAPLNFDPVA